METASVHPLARITDGLAVSNGAAATEVTYIIMIR
jgi:hypothetical protein